MANRPYQSIAQWYLTCYGLSLGITGVLCGLGMVPSMCAQTNPSSSTETNTTASAAQSALDEGIALYRQRTPKSAQQSLKKFEQAVKLFRIAKKRSKEALTLNNIGFVYNSLGDKQKAIRYLIQASQIWQEIGDKAGTARAFHNLGGFYDSVGEKQKALSYYNQSLPLSQAVGMLAQVAQTLNGIGSVYNSLGEKQKALNFFNQALTLSRTRKDQDQEATSLGNLGSVYSSLGEQQKALEYHKQALLLNQINHNREGEAFNLGNMGGVYSSLGQQKKALEHYDAALLIFVSMGDPTNEAITLTYMGSIYSELGQPQKALEYFRKALPLHRAVQNRTEEANTLNLIGSVYSTLGDTQKALNYYNQALPLSQSVGDRTGEAQILSSISVSYETLGEYQKALDFLNKALLLHRAVGNRAGESSTLMSLGNVYSALGENQKALDFLNQAFTLRRAVEDRRGEAATLNSIGLVYSALGEKQKALSYYNQALPILIAVGDRAGEAGILNDIGSIYDSLADDQQALKYFEQSLLLSRAVGNRNLEARTLNNIGIAYRRLGKESKSINTFKQALSLIQSTGDRIVQAITHFNIAFIHWDRGKLNSALEEIDAALQIVESLRTKINAQDLRASYFEAVQYYYQFKMDLLMEMHQQSPQKGYDRLAFETADSARARSFIELLAESGIDLQPTIENSALFDQEHQFQQDLRQLEQQRVALLSQEHTPQQVQELDRQSDLLLEKLQNLSAKIRATNPSYAAIKYPQPLTLQQTQQQVLDQDTVLLQYAIGEKQSYLWAVTINGIQSYPLPGESTINATAKLFRSVVANPGNTLSDIKRKGDALYQMILAPAANQLPGKRLLIVADGALQYVPFAALPLPNVPNYTPLLKDHEVINAPSAASVAVLRQQRFTIAPKTLAILADPVFRADDERVTKPINTALNGCVSALSKSTKPNATIAQTLPIDLQRTLRDFDLRSIQRLPNTRLEAEKILALVPPAQRTAACAFAANYDQVTHPQRDHLAQYRIIHFATHGFGNSSQPQLSGLVLSLVDTQGKPKNGFLRLHDIFRLKLAADLVVLSACQTGLGKEIKGEGLVGLTRGFMYAGSRRVVTSLWNVSDEATATLMTSFYGEMLQQKQTPAVALRAAQIKMWGNNPDPYLWAAFTLQGEWRP